MNRGTETYFRQKITELEKIIAEKNHEAKKRDALIKRIVELALYDWQRYGSAQEMGEHIRDIVEKCVALE